MSEYSAIVTAIIAALVALFVAWWKRPKDTADTIAVYQKIAYDAMQQVDKINEELHRERRAREDEKIGERMSRDKEIREIRAEIDHIRESKNFVIDALTNEVNTLKRENEALKELVYKHGLAITSLKKSVTGQLSPK